MSFFFFLPLLSSSFLSLYVLVRQCPRPFLGYLKKGERSLQYSIPFFLLHFCCYETIDGKRKKAKRAKETCSVCAAGDSTSFCFFAHHRIWRNTCPALVAKGDQRVREVRKRESSVFSLSLLHLSLLHPQKRLRSYRAFSVTPCPLFVYRSVASSLASCWRHCVALRHRGVGIAERGELVSAKCVVWTRAGKFSAAGGESGGKRNDEQLNKRT